MKKKDKEFFKEYLKDVDEEKYDELILLEKKNKSAEKKNRIGLMREDDFVREQQQVAYGIIELASSLKEED